MNAGESDTPLDRLRRRLRHDLRSPLAIIIGRADLVLSEVQGPVSDAQRRSLQAILASAERLDTLLGTVADQLDEVFPERPLPSSDPPLDAAPESEDR